VELAPHITLRIGELVLEGVSPSAWPRIEDALSREFESLLRERGLPDMAEITVDIESLDAGEIELASAGRPEEVGQRLAQSLYDAIVGGAR